MTTQHTALDFPIGQMGNIEQYIATVNAYPLLSESDEQQLAQRMTEEHDLEAARVLVLAHLRFVVHLARLYLGYGLSLNDLIQEGNIGLMKAVRRFDWTRGVRLVTFAAYWIKAEIHEFILRNWKLVKVATTKTKKQLFFKLRSLKQHSAAITYSEASEVAARLDVPIQEVLDIDQHLRDTPVSLSLSSEDDDPHQAPLELSCSAYEPSHLLEHAEESQRQEHALQAGLSELNDREQTIIQARWLAPEQSSLQTLATQYGISAERVRQIEKAALAKIRRTIIATE